MKRLKFNLCFAGGAAGFCALFLIIFLPIWFLVIDVDDEVAVVEECPADGFDYYKFIDCMPEVRNAIVEGSYNETACLAMGS